MGPLGPKCSQEPLEGFDSSEDVSEDESVEDLGATGGGKKDNPEHTQRHENGHGDLSVSASVTELVRQVSLLSSNMERVMLENRTLATSHVTMQSRLETLASSGGATPTVDILAALAAIGAPSLKEEPESLFTGARVTKRTITAAKAREFVNLSDFMPAFEPSSIMEPSLDSKTGQLTFRSKTAKRSIDNFNMWMSAWLGYESLVMEVDSAMYLVCTKYRLFMQKMDSLHVWSAVSAYDYRFRIKLSISNLWGFDTIDNDVHMSCFSSETLRPNAKTCFRCQSLDHLVKDCFLVEDGSFSKANQGQGARKKTFSNNDSSYFREATRAHPASGVYNPANQVCRDFNFGRCNRSPCVRRHVCSGCGGPDPIFKCPRCSANTAQGSFQPASGSVGPPHGPPPR